MREAGPSCPLFESQRPGLCRCRGVRDAIVPTLHERERYCHTNAFAACPTFRCSDGGEEPIDEDDYYRLWLARPGSDAFLAAGE